MNTKFIFITGGVTSSLGKGIASATLGMLLQSRGFKVILRKLDPYLNVDPGTMNPYQHGEVFVTEDGMETDLDLGHYERFTGINTTSSDYITTGQVYVNVISKERKGEYLGKTVQVIPHVTDEIKNFILHNTENADFVICEIGGTVGDIEGLPYLEAIRQLRNELGRKNTLFIHLTLIPYLSSAEELKTKPTQHSVKMLLSLGIQADILICRSDREITKEAIIKLALFCNVSSEDVIIGLNVQNIYYVPITYHNANFDSRICNYFNIDIQEYPINLNYWNEILNKIENPIHTNFKIAIVGKYTSLKEAYKSLTEAIMHASTHLYVKPEIVWVNSELEEDLQKLDNVHAIIIPGGFGFKGVEGKIKAITIARENKIPTLGICFGMQLTIIEACINILGIKEASSVEFGDTKEPVISLIETWSDQTSNIQYRDEKSDKGGTMRLGSYPCVIQECTVAHNIYKDYLNSDNIIYERHRHRYEVNIDYKERLENIGLKFSGMSPSGILTEIIEWTNHPFFVAVQFHPEFKSLPFKAHPLFIKLIEAGLKLNLNK